MDSLEEYHSVDIQWGNHDILWMGAAIGSNICVSGVITNSVRHNNLDILEDIYGINLRPVSYTHLCRKRNNRRSRSKNK